MQTDRTRRLAEESIPRLLWSFSMPAIVGMLAQALYNIVDRAFIGRGVGELGIAGIAVSFPYMLILLAFAMLIGFGASARISIRLGEGRKEEAEHILGNAVVLLLAVSVVLTVVGLFVLDPILEAFGASPTVLPLARDYLRVIVLGTGFEVVGFGLNAVIRGEGNPRIAMLTLLFGVSLNVVLAPIFIFGFGWGMKGAAWATVLAQAVSAAWVCGYFLSGRSLLKVRLKHLRIDPALVVLILGTGSPHFAMQTVASIMQSLLNHQLCKYGGDMAISIMAIIWALAMIVAMPVFGINQGAQPIIGFNYGARRFDRVKKALLTALLAASTITAIGFVVAMVFPDIVIRVFHRADAGLTPMLAMGTHAIRVSLAMLPLIGFQVISASYFQAVGKPRYAMFLMLSRQVILLIPAVLILPRFFGLEGVWLAIPLADLGSSILTAFWLVFELRRLNASHLEMELNGRLPGTGEPLMIETVPSPE